LVEGRRLILGGVEIPYERGLLGHSDADVLTHAICDAILGAAAMGDIGRHFPETDPRFKGISSLKLLGEVKRMIEDRYVVSNLDSIVIAERPKLAPYMDQMRANLAEVLGLDIAGISVKATTSEGLGHIGKGEAIAAWACVLLFRRKEDAD
jgi:2-C-methyl-D-erythritol 2,4-cyclodiphosphate synthase